MIDLKSRSMRDILVFSGTCIPDSRGEVYKYTLRDFLKNKLKIHDEISFEREHRVGKSLSSIMYVTVHVYHVYSVYVYKYIVYITSCTIK